MLCTLYQKRRPWSQRIFTLYSDRVVVESRTLRERSKYEVRLDKIGFDVVYHSDDTRAGKFMLYVCLIAPTLVTVVSFFRPIEGKVILLSWATGVLLALLNLAKEHSDDIQLLGGERALVFYRNIPDERKVLEFIDLVTRTAKSYVKERFTKVEVGIPEEIFMSRLYWLYEREIISDAELGDLRNEYQVKKLI